MFDQEPIPQLNLISPEKPNNFGDNPLDCALNALIYGLRTYRQEIGNQRFTHSNAGYFYHSLPPLDISKPEDCKQNEENKSIQTPQKNQSFIGLLRQIFSAYPQSSEKKPSYYLEAKKRYFSKKLFFENEGKFTTSDQELAYNEVSAIWNGSNNNSKKQTENDKPEELQIKISLQDLDQKSEQKVNASILAIQTALQIEKGNPEKILRNKQTAMEAINSLPHKTQLTIAFESRLNNSYEQFGFVNFLVYPPNPDSPTNDPNKDKDRIVIEVFINTEEPGKNKFGQEKSRFRKIIEISPEEHGIDPQQFESFLNEIYQKLLLQ